MAHVNGQQAKAWFDTSDASRALRELGIGKRVNLRCNRIELVVPATQSAYAAQVQAQWEYGYRQGMAAFAEVVA